jgi:pimeloyl-ACP methyl ester carboxylesterase
VTARGRSLAGEPVEHPPTGVTPTVLDIAALAADIAEDLVLGTVRDVHGAVATRVQRVVSRFLGGRAALPHRVHDEIADTVYTSISAGLTLSASALRTAGRAGLSSEIDQSLRGRRVVAAVNGIIGDRLRDVAPGLTLDMGVRVEGRDVTLEADEIAAAFQEATDSLVVFVHGLSEDEASWERAQRPRGGQVPVDQASVDQASVPRVGRSYGECLKAQGWTPVYVRVNTGLAIAENGFALAEVMDRLVAGWPVDVLRIAFVGHSMGGLVVRAACAVSGGSDSPWTNRVSDVVCLGTPHLGAPLERAVDHGVRVLGVLPESAPFARILEHRSVGILDLRHGLARDVQNLPHARYRLVAATLTRSARSVASATIGDYLVPYASALGRPGEGAEMFPGAATLHVPLADHFDLLNHHDVHVALQEWLLDRSDPPTRSESLTGHWRGNWPPDIGAAPSLLWANTPVSPWKCRDGRLGSDP